MSTERQLVERAVTTALGRRQHELACALTGTGPVPAGFDHGAVEAPALALLSKRSEEVARVWPGLLQTALARRRFRDWAGHRPKLNSVADGYAFALWLRARGQLPQTAAGQLARVRRHYRPRPDGTLAPRWAARLRHRGW